MAAPYLMLTNCRLRALLQSDMLRNFRLPVRGESNIAGSVMEILQVLKCWSTTADIPTA